MSQDQSAEKEIVIVRRRGEGGEEGHHGGAWKIAYADFMTAMMAFFLVMWLVNAADKKVLTQIASYFNPLKMSDRVTSKKGVEELVENSQSKSGSDSGGSSQKSSKGKSEGKSSDAAEAQKKSEKSEAAKDSEKKDSKSSGDKASKNDLTEQELFSDPYGILEKLAAQAMMEIKPKVEAKTGNESRKNGGLGFRDPFDPQITRRQPEVETEPELPPEEEMLQDAASPSKEKENRPKAPASPGGEEIAGVTEPKEAADDKENGKKPDPAGHGRDPVEDLRARLETALKDFAAGKRPSLAVESTSEGMLISLTDEFDFEMFRVASAEPNPLLVAGMKKIAETLKDTAGKVVIRGHTDARPFRKGSSDNWRLSTQRALVTRYMLINGGLDEKRFVKIEGYADTKLRVAKDPLAAPNRRIEIMIKAGQPE